MLTANFPREAAASYRLAGLHFTPVNRVTGTGRAAGTAWLVGDTLVLAGAGYGPAIDGLERNLERRLP